MTKIRTIFCLLIALIGFSACSRYRVEMPSEAIESIIQLFEKRDFDTLIRSRYAEIGKAENEAQIEILIGKFQQNFESDEVLNSGIAIYRAALETEPEYSDDGMIVIFKTDQGSVKLSQMENGNWGFHL